MGLNRAEQSNGRSAESAEPSATAQRSEPGHAAPAAVPTLPPPGWRVRTRATLDTIRANPTGRVALKVIIGLIGALVVVVGIALIPLPGPGWALVILGLAIWAIEFAWAKHLLHFTRLNVQKWTRWVGRQSLVVRLVLGAVGLVFVAAVVWASLKFSVGIDVLDSMRNYLATR